MEKWFGEGNNHEHNYTKKPFEIRMAFFVEL